MASSSIGSLAITLTLDNKQFSASLTKVKQSSSKGASDLKNAWSGAAAFADAAVAKAFDKISSTISNAIGPAIKRVDSLNNFPKVMESLGFSAEESTGSIRAISDSLDGLPTSLDEATTNVQMLTATMGNLNKGEVNATKVGIAFNNMMLAGGQGTQAASNALTQYNQMLAVGKVDQQAWNSLVTAAPGQLNQVAQSLLGASANQKTLYEAMKEGTVSFDDFNAAIVKLNQEGGEGFGSFEDQARAATGGIGTALENVQNRAAKAIGSVIDTIGSENIAGAINDLSSKFADLANGVSEVIKFFQQNEGAARGLEAALIAVGVAIGTIKVASFVMKLASLLSTVVSVGSALWTTVVPALIGFGITLFTTVIPAVWAFTAALLANPITWIVLAVAALIAAIVALVLNFDKVKEAVSQAFNKIGEVIGGVADFIKGVFAGIGEFIGGVVENIKGFFVNAWNFISGIFSTVGSFLANVFATPIAIISKIIEIILKIGEIIGKVIYGTVAMAVGFFATIFQNLWNGITAGLAKVGAFFSTVFQSIMEAVGRVGEFFSSVFNGVWEFISGIVENVKNAFQGVWDFITGIFGGVAQWFGDRFTEAFNKIKGVFEGIGNFFRGVWDTITGIFSKIGTAIGDAVSGAFKSVVNGILSFIEGFINGIIRTINGFIGGINSVFGAVGVHIDPIGELALNRLAQGGYADGATAAIFGEAGKEVALPLEHNTDNWSGLLAAALAEEFEMGEISTGGERPINNTQNIIVNDDMDIRKVGNAFLQEIRRVA